MLRCAASSKTSSIKNNRNLTCTNYWGYFLDRHSVNSLASVLESKVGSQRKQFFFNWTRRLIGFLSSGFDSSSSRVSMRNWEEKKRILLLFFFFPASLTDDEYYEASLWSGILPFSLSLSLSRSFSLSLCLSFSLSRSLSLSLSLCLSLCLCLSVKLSRIPTSDTNDPRITTATYRVMVLWFHGVWYYEMGWYFVVAEYGMVLCYGNTPSTMLWNNMLWLAIW